MKINKILTLTIVTLFCYSCEEPPITHIEEITNEINGYEYVDLGLPSGIKWSKCNIGAMTPEDYGYYISYGELQPKPNYLLDNSTTLNQNLSDISGNVEYDIATTLWKSPWRIPTAVEVQELLDVCEWQWIRQGNINGYIVIGPNKNSIFLPAAGFYYGYYATQVNNMCFYWTSTPSVNDNRNSEYLYGDKEIRYISLYNRCVGCSIRPVVG